MRIAGVVFALGLVWAACQGTSDPSFPPRPHMVVRFGYFGDSTGAYEFVARASRPSLLDSVRADVFVTETNLEQAIGVFSHVDCETRRRRSD